MNKRVEQGAATRLEIVRTATRLFAEAGYEATSIEVLLEALQISRGALYHHFRGKDAVFQAVVEAIEQTLTGEIIAASGTASDPEAALRAGAAAWLRLAQDPVIRQVVLIDAPAVLGWEKWRELDQRYGLGLLRTALEGAARSGRLRTGEPDLLAHLLLAALAEAALVVSRAADPAAATEAASAALNKLIDGLFA